MALYRIYIDEVGNHDLTHADDPNQRYQSLTGVILESEYTLNALQPEMDQICAILRQSKYHRNWKTGQIEGYGKKMLP
ncbi:MAG: DUF3800 domain-containing protein [Anaerolineales bacterium]|nr:DUF3800 domain-containing protein [Anaerolineales bacterium]MDP3184851.1 DUF3800 domain-containing protein [Anaerolineales bacterium]